MSFNLRYYFLVSDNKQRNYNSMSGPPSKFVVVNSHGPIFQEKYLQKLQLPTIAPSAPPTGAAASAVLMKAF